MKEKPIVTRLILTGMLSLLSCCAVPLFQEALGQTKLESPSFCFKTTEDKTCDEPGCKRTFKEECYHGDCSDAGECVCQACWEGPSCNMLGNHHTPVFVQPAYEEYISPDEPAEYPFMYVRATDEDAATCAASKDCPCAEIVYSLGDNVDDDDDDDDEDEEEVEEGGAKRPFYIDPQTGGISVVTTGSRPSPNSRHEMKAYAKNRLGDGVYGMVRVVVIVSDFKLGDGGQGVKLRKLQGAAEVTDLGVNNTLDITFRPSDNDSFVGSLTVGTRVECVLTISIPEAVLVEDVLVEIFTEDENNTLAVMCPPALTKGAEIEITDSVQPVESYHQEGNPYLIDTAIYTFGNVSNQNTSTAAEASQIVITFAITMHEAMSLAADERYWVSAGVDYNGETKLWVGQIGFLVDQEPQYPPATNITLDGPINYYKSEVEVFNLDLNVYRRVANLTVQAAAGIPIQSNLLICDLQLCSTGSGFCLNADLDLATFTVDLASQNTYESMFRFGNIVNGGAANSTTDSRISMDIVTYLRDDSAVVDGTTYDLTASADDGALETQNTMTFTAKASRSYITPARVLTMNISVVDGDDALVPGESVKVRVSIIVPYSTSASPVTVSLQPSSADERFQICAVRINHVGDDISCLLQRRDDIEGSVVYGAGPNATIWLSGIANTGSESTADGVNDVIGVDFVVKSTLSDLADHDAGHPFLATVDYAAGPLTDSMSIKTITDPAFINYPAVPIDAATPVNTVFDLLNPDDEVELAPGEYIMLALRPVIEPDTMYKYTVTALINTTDATLLDMRVLSVGSNIACGLLDDDPAATYTNAAGDETRNTAELELGLVYNFARPGSPVSQKDSLEIMLTVMVTPGAGDGDIPVAAAVLVGATRLWVAEGNITALSSVAKVPTLPTNNTFAVKPTYPSELVPGTETKVLHTLVIPANSSFKHVVNYTITMSWLRVIDVNVTSVGDQLLCMEEGVLSPTYGYSDDGMFAVVDLGFMCNVPIKSNASEEDSTLVLEITMYIINSSDIEVGSTSVLTASLDVSNIEEEMKTESKELIFSVALPNSSFKLCCPESAYYMRPGQVERCNVTLDMLDKALVIRLELETPFNETAAITLTNVEVGPVGLNVRFDPPEPLLTSSANTSQKNMAVLDFGEVTNVGDLQAGDNQIVIYVDVQMADSAQNDNYTEHVLEAGVAVSHGVVIWVAYYKLTVVREGTERPALNMSFTHNSSLATHSVGDTVWYQVDITHDTGSNAEVVNLQGHIFLPPYIQFDSMVPNNELSPQQPSMDISDNNSGFYFTVPNMFFSDRIAFSIQTTIKTNYRYKLTKDWRGTTPIELVYYMSNYDTNYYTDGQYFSQPMDYVTFKFTVPYPEIPGPDAAPTCGSPQPQGMASLAIKDCQITASFSPDPAASAKHARLNGPSAWKTPARAGPFLYDRWIKVDLGKKTAVTGVQTQGGSSPGADGDLGEFEILYSLDDILYMAASPSDNKLFDHKKDAPADHNTVVNHSLLVPVKARYVILNLTAYDYNGVSKWYNALRMEILGCAIDGETAADICPTAAPSTVPQVYDRGFLVDRDTDTDTETLFVCDTVTHGQSGLRKELRASVYTIKWRKPDMQCFMMIYAEKRWTGLDSRLRNIFGFLPSTGRMYGVMGNSPDSYAASDRPYRTWFLTSESDYIVAEGTADFVRTVPVPLVSNATTGFEYATPDSSDYSISDWKATMSGIFNGEEKVLDWNECCQPTCAASGGPDGCS